MRIYDSFGPNPRALRMFLLEKAIEVPKVEVDLLGMENRRPQYTDRNPGGQLPALGPDDGRVVGETVQPVAGELANVSAWFERVGARPSAAGSLHPMSAALGSAG